MSGQIVEVASGKTLFFEGDKSEWYYILLSGSVGVWKNGNRLLGLGSRQTLGLEGNYNAELVYAYTAKTEGACRLVRYPAAMIDDHLLQNPRLAPTLLAGVCSQLDRCWNRIAYPPAQEPVYYTGEIRTYKPGQMVIKEGNTCKDIFRIISTDLGLEVAKRGKRLALITDTGEFFGEMASLLDEPRTADVISVGNSALEIYSPEQLNELLSDYPNLAQRMISTLVHRLAQTTRQLSEQQIPV